VPLLYGGLVEMSTSPSETAGDRTMLRQHQIAGLGVLVTSCVSVPEETESDY